MPDKDRYLSDSLSQCQAALSQWDNEGEMIPDPASEAPVTDSDQPGMWNH